MILPLVAAAWVGHTSASRAAADDVALALDAIGMKQDTAADLMGVAPEDLSKQLAGVKPLNFWRMQALPPAFQLHYARLAMGRIGAVVLSAEERSFLLGAAQLGVKRAIRMVPDLFHERRRA